MGYNTPQEAENWKILNSAFAKIRALTQPQIPVLFVIHPELQEMEHYLFTEIHEIAKKLCLDYGFFSLGPAGRNAIVKSQGPQDQRGQYPPQCPGKQDLRPGYRPLSADRLPGEMTFMQDKTTSSVRGSRNGPDVNAEGTIPTGKSPLVSSCGVIDPSAGRV